MRGLLTLAGTVLLFLSLGPLTSTAQDRNMTGAWIVTSPPNLAGQEQRIEQDETTFTRGHEIVGHRMTYKLDGTESSSTMWSPLGNIVILGTATMVGRQVVIDETVHLPTGERRRMKLTYWLGADGRLYHNIIEIIRGKEQPPIKVLMRRK
jgi:hypothetical protein